MARALRVERPGERYHVTSRGNERKTIFPTEADRRHFVRGLVLGTAAFARNLRRPLVGNPRQQSQFERLVPPVSWARIIAGVEPAKEERWGEFSGRHGDWGRDVALRLGRGAGRLRLAQLVELAGGMDYVAMGQAVSRFSKRLLKEPALRRQMNHMKAQLSNVET